MVISILRNQAQGYLLSKVIQQMKLRVTKIKLFNCMQSNTFCITSTNQACNQNFSKGKRRDVFETKDKSCMRLTDIVPGGFCNFSEKNSHFNDSWMTFRLFVDPSERTNR